LGGQAGTTASATKAAGATAAVTAPSIAQAAAAVDKEVLNKPATEEMQFVTQGSCISCCTSLAARLAECLWLCGSSQQWRPHPHACLPAYLSLGQDPGQWQVPGYGVCGVAAGGQWLRAFIAAHPVDHCMKALGLKGLPGVA
jgi:hypothetical protein